jgi:hypothetical protein
VPPLTGKAFGVYLREKLDLGVAGAQLHSICVALFAEPDG